jgi:hypothetical protein
MTPQEKANELVNKFMEYSHTDFIPYQGGYQMDSQIENAKQCALIAVDEIIQEMNSVMLPNPFKQYWQEVKQQIEQL